MESMHFVTHGATRSSTNLKSGDQGAKSRQRQSRPKNFEDDELPAFLMKMMIKRQKRSQIIRMLTKGPFQHVSDPNEIIQS